jgi:hypothetical protein
MQSRPTQATSLGQGRLTTFIARVMLAHELAPLSLRIERGKLGNNSGAPVLSWPDDSVDHDAASHIREGDGSGATQSASESGGVRWCEAGGEGERAGVLGVAAKRFAAEKSARAGADAAKEDS